MPSVGPLDNSMCAFRCNRSLMCESRFPIDYLLRLLRDSQLEGNPQIVALYIRYKGKGIACLQVYLYYALHRAQFQEPGVLAGLREFMRSLEPTSVSDHRFQVAWVMHASHCDLSVIQRVLIVLIGQQGLGYSAPCIRSSQTCFCGIFRFK